MDFGIDERMDKDGLEVVRLVKTPTVNIHVTNLHVEAFSTGMYTFQIHTAITLKKLFLEKRF